VPEVWLDRLKGKVGGTYTGVDVAFYMDWYSWLAEVADYAGCDLGNAPAWYNDAVAKAGAGNLDGAYTSSKYAVAVARSKLIEQANQEVLVHAYDTARADIVSKIQSYESEGIDVSGFKNYLSLADNFRKTGGMQLCVGVYILKYLSADLVNFADRWRSQAVPLGPQYGLYDMPAETTDVIVMDQFPCESASVSFLWAQSAEFQSMVVQAVKDLAGTGVSVLRIDVRPPKVVVYIKGSPIAPIIVGLIALMVAGTICATVVMKAYQSWIVGPQLEALRLQAESKREIAQIEYDTTKLLADMKAKGQISEDTFEHLVEEVKNGYTQIAQSIQAPSWGLGDITKLIGVVVGAGLVFWLLSQLPKKKEKE
jgi:hypothetical protein